MLLGISGLGNLYPTSDVLLTETCAVKFVKNKQTPCSGTPGPYSVTSPLRGHQYSLLWPIKLG